MREGGREGGREMGKRYALQSERKDVWRKASTTVRIGRKMGGKKGEKEEREIRDKCVEFERRREGVSGMLGKKEGRKGEEKDGVKERKKER